MNEEPEPRRGKDASATALAWWVKCDAGPLSSEDRAALDAWLAEDPAHRAAFDEAAALFGEVQTIWTAGRRPAARRSRALAASALAAASLAAFLWLDELSLRWRADVLTGAGETRAIALEDGSRVELAPRSALALRYRGGERRLALLAGEAYFQAAPDPSRPFVVEAAGGTVTALGTAFDIATETAHAEVVVAEHRVAIAIGGERVVVEEGQQSGFGPGARVARPEAVDLFKATGWRRGRLVFEDQPLGEVARTLGLYHAGYIVAAPSVREQRVTGTFDAANPLGAIRAIEASLGLRALRVTDYFIYLYR
jgi:transmembrane sensor